MVLFFFLPGFFGSYEEEIGISEFPMIFSRPCFLFFGEEPSQQNVSNLVANVVRNLAEMSTRTSLPPVVFFFLSLAVGWTTRSRFLSLRIRKNPQNIRGVFFSKRDVRYIFENTLRFGDYHHDLKLGIS